MTWSKSRLVLSSIKRAIKAGALVYWVCPLIEDSENSDLIAVNERYNFLKNNFKEKSRINLVKCFKVKDKDSIDKYFHSFLGEGYEGIIIRNSKIVDSAPNAYFTHFNWSRFLNLLKDNNIPSKTSSDAGTYLCNYTSFLFQDCIHQMQLDTKQGFIHIPKMDIKVLNKALNLLIQSLEA